MNKMAVQWGLLTILVFLFPAVIPLIFAFPVVPLGYLIIRIVIPAIFTGQFVDAAIIMMPISLWVLILYYVSRLIAQRIVKLEAIKGYALLAVLLALIFLVALSPIYDSDINLLEETSSAFYMYKELLPEF